jgi:hypothetical protein
MDSLVEEIEVTPLPVVLAQDAILEAEKSVNQARSCFAGSQSCLHAKR